MAVIIHKDNNLTTLTCTNFTIYHKLHLAYYLKQKLSLKQDRFSNYYTFTQVLHRGQELKQVVKKLKKDLWKVDKKAFIIIFKVRNNDSAFNFFCKHTGNLHIHCLIYTNKYISIDALKNKRVKQNKLKNKIEYEKQDSTLFINYIFTRHTIFKLYDNRRVKKLVKYPLIQSKTAQKVLLNRFKHQSIRLSKIFKYMAKFRTVF